MPTLSKKNLLVGLCYCLLIALVVLFVDQSAATWSYQVLQKPFLLVLLTRLPEPLVALSCLGFLALGGASLVGYKLNRSLRILLVCCFATLLAFVLKEQLKIAFGRTWPETFTNNNPSWIQNGIAIFSPFHGGKGYASFPSGHTATITAPMVVLWFAAGSCLRWFYVVPVGLVAIGLLGANYHFIGDILAGALVGWISATITLHVIPIAKTY